MYCLSLYSVFEKDLDYWNIDPYSLEPCCALKYFPEVDVRQNEKDMDLRAKIKAMETAEEEDFGSSPLSELRGWLWNVLEYPWTSKLAQFLAFFSLSMILLSTITFIISTADELKARIIEKGQNITINIIEKGQNITLI